MEPSILFSFQPAPHKARHLARLLRRASKQRSTQPTANAYFATLCARHGYTPPETAQIMITDGHVFVFAPEEVATTGEGKGQADV